MQGNSTDLDDGFGHWLAGFADGEGHFSIHRATRRRTGEYTGYGFRFIITLRADDRDILEEMQRRTGLGRIYGPQPQRGRGGAPQMQWTIFTKADCLALVEIFDKYPLRAKKARDYAIWKAGIQDWGSITTTPRVGIPRNWTRIASLRRALMAGRTYAEGVFVSEPDVDDFVLEFEQLMMED